MGEGIERGRGIEIGGGRLFIFIDYLRERKSQRSARATGMRKIHISI